MKKDRERRGRRRKHRANSEGSVYCDANGRWRGALVIGWLGDKPKRKFFTGDTQEEVVDKLQKARHDLRLGILSEAPERQTLEQYLTSWIADVATPRVRPKTLAHYKFLVEQHIVPSIGRVPLLKLTPQQVQMMLTEKMATLSAKTCQHLRTCLRVALGTAVKWNLIARNAAALTDPPPAPERKVRSMNEEELGAFEKAARGHHFEAAFVLALSTGMREAEILGLQWPRVDLEAKRVEVVAQLQRIDGKLTLTTPKTRKSIRTIRLCDAAVKALATHKMIQEADRQRASTRWRQTDFVFTNPATGTPLDQRTLVEYFYKIRDAAGIKNLRFHDLRHSCASFLLAHGVPVKMISELLGHSSTAFTMDVYGHVLPQLQEQAATEMDAIIEAAKKAQREREEREKTVSGAATGAARAENSAAKPLVN